MNRNPYRSNHCKAPKRVTLKAQKKAHRRSRSKKTVAGKRVELFRLPLPSALTLEISILDCHDDPFTYLAELLTD